MKYVFGILIGLSLLCIVIAFLLVGIHMIVTAIGLNHDDKYEKIMDYVILLIGVSIVSFVLNLLILILSRC